MNEARTNQPRASDKTSIATTTDERLMLAYGSGDSEAFTELFRRYSQPVYGFFRRRLDDPARAEELSQETFVGLIRGIERYEPRASFRSYLYGIAMKILMAERRKTSRREISSDSPKEIPVESAVDAGIWVRSAIEQLDSEQREVLLLREYERLSYEEIAGLLGLPINTVRSKLFRARLALRDFLLPLRPEIGNRS